MGSISAHDHFARPAKKQGTRGRVAGDGNGETSLWACVLQRTFYDLCNPSYAGQRFREDAERWVGDYPSATFSLVVSLAGLEPDAVWPTLKKIARSDVSERKRFLERLDLALSTNVGGKP